MNRLQAELTRLYGPDTIPAPDDAAGTALAPGPHAGRALVLELLQPAGWAQLASVWNGAQSDLDLPAPAIAVSGVDGLQLWFSLASPTSQHAGALFLEGLCGRYLPDVPRKQVRLVADPTALPAMPPVEVAPERWSAFVTPDLASVFAETPWLDVPPGEEGQAAILRALHPMPQAAVDAVLAQFAATAEEASRESAPSMPPDAQASGHDDPDPVRFL